jgi:hypothetical protein
MNYIPIGDFEKKIIDFFDDISTINLGEYHQLMREYAKVWKEICNDKAEKIEKGKKFLEKINQMPLSYNCAENILNEEGKPACHFNKNPEIMNKLPWTIFLSKNKAKGFVCSNAFNPMDFFHSEMYLANSIMMDKGNFSYSFGFNMTPSSITFGLPFASEQIEEKYFHDTMSACYTITFPKESPFEKALISISKHEGKYLLEEVLVKLDSEIKI